MAAKTIFGSGFDFLFVFSIVDLLENEYNIERVSQTRFEIFEAKVQKFKTV